MRTFAILILLLNLSYFAWAQVRQVKTADEFSPQTEVFAPAEQSLILLAELPPKPSPFPGQEEIFTGSIEQTTLSPEPLQEEVRVEAPSTAVPQPLCYSVSGFEDENEATAFVAEIGEMGITGWTDVQQEQISSTWWVHLPPFKSQIEAQKVIDELVAKGIENFYMRTGDMAGGISLGVYSRERSATTAQSELRARGYEASIKEIPRFVSKAYVLMEMDNPLLSETIEWKAFLAKKATLELTEKLCETIARQNQFP